MQGMTQPRRPSNLIRETVAHRIGNALQRRSMRKDERPDLAASSADPAIGIVNNHTDVHAASPSEADQSAAFVYDILHNRIFAEPVLLGAYPDLEAVDIRPRADRRQREAAPRAVVREEMREPEQRFGQGPERRESFGFNPFRLFGAFD